MLPQSTVVDSLNEGMVRIYEDRSITGPEGLNLDILAQVHDSVLMQVPIAAIRSRERFEKLVHTISDYTSPDITYSGRTFKIASDYKFGLNWGEYNANSNPGGMQEFEDYDSFMKALEQWERLRGEGTQQLA